MTPTALHYSSAVAGLEELIEDLTERIEDLTIRVTDLEEALEEPNSDE